MFGNRSVTADLRAQQQQIEQRKQLVECVHAEIEAINKIFVKVQQKQDAIDQTECLTAIEEALSAIERILLSDWESSLFLRNTIKPIKELQEKMFNLKTQLSTDHRKKVVPPEIIEGMIPIYIGLFQAEGLSLGRWTMQMRSLGQYVQGRPVYIREVDVKQMIRRKLDSSNNAYVVVAIKPEMIIRESLPRYDNEGCELMTLADDAVSRGQLIEFVHQKKHYCWVDQNLILQD